MGASYLRVLDFDGLSMTGTEFNGCFLVDFDIAAQFPLEAVMSEAVGDFPTFVRGDPQDRVIPLHIIINNSTQALIDELKARFSPFLGEVLLQVEDEAGNIRQMTVKSLGLTPWEGHSESSYVASLEAAEPIWEDTLITGTAVTAAASPTIWNQYNLGNVRAFPEFTLEPQAVKGAANDYIKYWPLSIAWRSEFDGVDSQGLGYPIDIVDRSFDTAAEILAGRMQADGDDIKVLVDGVDTDRYLDDINTTGTAVWCSIAFQPMKTAIQATTLIWPDFASIDIHVSNPEGTSGFPDYGWLLIDDEAFFYPSKTQTIFLNCIRESRGTAGAAHGLGSTIYWIEHDIVLLTNYSGETAPLADTDREPIIDKALSSNAEHHYTTGDGLIEPDSLRTGQWLRELRGSNLLAAAVRLRQNAGVIEITDDFPEAGDPNFDSISLYAPCLIPRVAGSIELDYTIGFDMVGEIIGVDREGFEALLARRDAAGEAGPLALGEIRTNPAAETNVTFLPPGLLSRLTLHARVARVTGTDEGFNGSGFQVGGAGALLIAETFTLQQETQIFGVKAIISGNLATDDIRPEIWKTSGGAPVQTEAAMFTTALNLAVPFTEIQWWNRLANLKLPAGTYALVFRPIAGLPSVGGASTPFFGGGSVWFWDGAVWTETAVDDLAFTILTDDEINQPDAMAGDGGESTHISSYENVTVEFDTTRTPAAVVGAPDDLYYVQGTLSNDATNQGLAIRMPLRLNTGLGATFDSLLIDCDRHIVSFIPDFGAIIGYDVPGAVEPSDLQEWLRLQPGDNALRWTEGNIGAGSIDVTPQFRPRWT